MEKHKLLNTNELYVVALSGGADSVALLLLLQEAGYRIEAAHCNFHLRGEESDRDEAFCEQLCRNRNIPFHRAHFDTQTYAELHKMRTMNRNIPFHRAHFDTQTYAELHKMSIEMAARELRYKWFEQLRSDLGAAGICVAHHRDDAVETVLLNLVRGTGLRGLCGIQPRNGYILRPLLCVSREEIEAFLADRGQEYVTDSTNLEADVLRNKVRLQVLPLLKTLNPAVVENVQRTAENLMGAQAALDAVFLHNKNHNVLILSDYEDCASREYVSYEWAKTFGFNGSQIRQILEAETGKIITSPLGYDILRDRGRLLVEPSLKPLKPLRIPEEGTYVFNENSRFSVKKQAVYISKTADLATLDAAQVVFPLTIRRVEEGDWMIPYGMKGRKLLSDLMTDRKMTVFEKRRQLVVVDAQGVVLWLVGLRVDARVAVGSATSEVLVLRFDANEA